MDWVQTLYDAGAKVLVMNRIALFVATSLILTTACSCSCLVWLYGRGFRHLRDREEYALAWAFLIALCVRITMRLDCHNQALPCQCRRPIDRW